MKEQNFYAMLSRMKYIQRWGLMRSSREENLSEHTLEVATLSHALCIIANRRLGKNLDASKAVLFALYHDCSEILTGDLPTPVKYFNPVISAAYKEVEKVANEKLLTLLPEDLRPDYALFFDGDKGEIGVIIKAADRLSALIKCIEEGKGGNDEFIEAEKTIRASIIQMHLPEADIFLREFLPAYSLTLDEMER